MATIQGAWHGETSFPPLSAYLPRGCGFKPRDRQMFLAQKSIAQLKVDPHAYNNFQSCFLPFQHARCYLDHSFLRLIHSLEYYAGCKLLPSIYLIIPFYLAQTCPPWLGLFPKWDILCVYYNAQTSLQLLPLSQPHHHDLTLRVFDRQQSAKWSGAKPTWLQ